VPKGFEFVGLEPFRHQIVTLLFGLHYGDIAIFSTMGTGKTRCAIDLSRYHIQTGEVKRILVVCPSSVLGNWKKEVQKFSEHSAVVLHHQDRNKRLKLFKEDVQFYILNYEATFRFLKQILKLKADMVVFDESSRISNPKTKQTKASMEIAGHSKYRVLLNGTPIANKPLDLWAQMYCLDFGDTLGKTFGGYRRAYFATIKMKNKSGQYFSVYKIRNKNAMNEVAKRLSRKSIRYTKEECIKDLPEKTYQTRVLELPKASRKLYDEVHENAKLEILKLGQNISALIILTKFIKAAQICSGYLKTDEGNYIKLKTNPKLKELESIIEEIVPSSAMVIWCKYLFTIELVQKLLESMRLNYLTIKGDVKDKSEIAETFQNTTIEDIPIIVCQIRSAGLGINLHKANYAVYVENEWRLLDRLQSMDRIHRIGQKNVCTYIDLVVHDSIDELILKAIQQKEEVANYIIRKVR
jgi:SNF2 family DNA or RNA helicase